MTELSFEKRARRFVTLEEDIVFLERGVDDKQEKTKQEDTKEKPQDKSKESVG